MEGRTARTFFALPQRGAPRRATVRTAPTNARCAVNYTALCLKGVNRMHPDFAPLTVRCLCMPRCVGRRSGPACAQVLSTVLSNEYLHREIRETVRVLCYAALRCAALRAHHRALVRRAVPMGPA